MFYIWVLVIGDMVFIMMLCVVFLLVSILMMFIVVSFVVVYVVSFFCMYCGYSVWLDVVSMICL